MRRPPLSSFSASAATSILCSRSMPQRSGSGSRSAPRRRRDVPFIQTSPPRRATGAPAPRLLDAIADACQRYTPLVAVDPPDGILLDIGGCAHLFGGEEKLRDDVLVRMTRFGFSARAAVAATIGAASAAARFGDGL